MFLNQKNIIEENKPSIEVYIHEDLDKYELEEQFIKLLKEHDDILLETNKILTEENIVNKKISSFNNRFTNRIAPIYNGLAGLAQTVSDRFIKSTTDVNVQLKIIKKAISDEELKRNNIYLDNTKYYIPNDVKLEFPLPPLKNVKKDLLTFDFPIWFVRTNSISTMQDYLENHTKSELKSDSYISAYKLVEKMKEFLPKGYKRYKEIIKMIEDTKSFIDKVKDLSINSYKKYLRTDNEEELNKKLDNLMNNIERLTNSISVYHRAVSYLYIDSIDNLKDIIQDIYSNMPDEAKTTEYYRSFKRR